MQVVRAVVGGELVGAAIEREAALGDAVAHAPDNRAEVGLLGQVAVDAVEPEHDIAQLPVAVGGVELGEDRAVGHHLGDHPPAPVRT